MTEFFSSSSQGLHEYPVQRTLPRCHQDYCRRNGCQTSDLTKLPAPMFKCGKCDIQYVNHVGVKQHMKEKHSAVALGRPKIRDPSGNGVGMTQVEKIKKESNDGKVSESERRFDEPPFDPVTRDKSIRMLDASTIPSVLKISTYYSQLLIS